MIDGLLHTAQGFVQNYGVLGMFVAALLEEIVAPIPSALVMMSSGFFFLAEQPIGLNTVSELIFRIALPLALGVTLGSLLVYFIAYYAGKPVLDRFGKYLGVSWRDVERVEKYFDKSHTDEIFLFLFRAVPIIPNVAINAFAGLVQWDVRTYLLITFFGTWVRAIIIAFLGWQLGNFYEQYAFYIESVENIALITIALAVATFVGYRLWMKYRNKKA